MVSLMAARSNSVSRAGMTTNVADWMASATIADMFGGVSMKSHS
jgi:hypothetical protein